MKTLFLILLIIFVAVISWYFSIKKTQPLNVDSYEKPAVETLPNWNDPLYPDAKGQKIMKQGQERVTDDDFQQVEKCETCGKLFWAVSELELGNWQRDCSDCSSRIKKEEEEKEEHIKKNGKPRLGYKKQIFAWTLGNDTVFNRDYEPSNRMRPDGKYTEYEIWMNGFIDADKFEKDFGDSKDNDSRNP